MIPEETIQRVIAATDIVELIGRYVKLKRAGTRFTGLCPFHTEKSPSFSVSPQANAYHCFGCGAGGTAIRFLMEHDGMQFGEAVKKLAEAAGIRVDDQVWDANAEREARQRSELKKLQSDTAEWYHNLLLRHPAAEPARAYLKSRGISAAVAKNWQLGYAPEDQRMARQWCVQNKITDQLLVQGGLMRESDDRRTYFTFRHRLMFPIRNENGEVIAFSGRVLSSEQKGGKYVNSPETPIFIKGKHFFGFDKSKRPISKAGQAIVCEGQIDLVMLYENGFQNVCAGLGTAFTDDHAKLLKRHCDEVILCYDSDNAGYAAAKKTHAILSPVGLNVKVAVLPKGEDPDSLIRAQGRDAFAVILERAQDFLDFQIAHQRSSIGGNELRHQVQLIEQTAVTIAMDPSVSARDLMIRSHAAQLGIGEDALRKQVQVFIRRRAQDAERAKQQAVNRRDEAPAGSSTLTPAEAGKRLLASQHRTALLVTRLALAEPEVLMWLREQELDDLFNTLPGTELLRAVWRSLFTPGDNGAIAAWLTTQEQEVESAFAQLLSQASPKGDIKQARESLSTLETTKLQQQIQQARSRLTHGKLTQPEEAELTLQVNRWVKEYVDRTQGGSDGSPR
jgi:DNA primase